MLKSLSIFLCPGKDTLAGNEATGVKGAWEDEAGSHRWRQSGGPSREDLWATMKNKGTCTSVPSA